MEFLAGCVGGCAGVIVGHPLDTIKVKLQTQDFKNPKYRGTWDCFSKTFKQTGARGLYRGITSPLSGVAAINAVIFGVHGNVSRRFEQPDAMYTHMVAGATAGIVQSFICSPVELAKTRLQLQATASARYKGPMDCLRQIYRQEGMRGVFRGQGVTIAREIPAFSSYFLTFEYLIRELNEDKDKNVSAQSVLFAGGMAGTVSWIVSYPIDVIKSRIQSDGVAGKSKYSGVFDCAKQSVRQEGWSVLTRGLSSTVIRAFPTNAATFFVVSAIMKLVNQAPEGSAVDKESVLQDIFTSGENILQTARKTLDDSNNNGARNINLLNNYNADVINKFSGSFLLKNKEEIFSNFMLNNKKNSIFYDSYCRKMSYFNCTQAL